MGRKAVLMACDTLDAALKPLKDKPSEANERPDKKTLLDIAEKLKNQAAQGAVLWNDTSAPSADSQSSFLDSFQQTAIAFCTCCHGFTQQAGPSLLEDLQNGATAVIQASKQLLKGLGEKDAAEVRQLVGKLWDALAAVKQLPVDNKSSIFQRLLKHVTVMKDVLRELDDLSSDQPSSSSAANGSSNEGPSSQGDAAAAGQKEADDEDDDDDLDLDYDAGPLSEAELRVLALTKSAVNSTLNCMKQFGRWLLKGKEVTPNDGLDGWESILFHSRNLQRCVEDLGAAMYSPQDRAEILSLAESMSATLEVLLLEIPQETEGDIQPSTSNRSQELETLQKESEAAFEALLAEMQGS